jgi:LPXTG-motif cell wall-anchored protein
MKGNVIGFDPDTNTGAISGHDGKRYEFATTDWHAHQHQPKHGDLVDFAPDGQRATQIYLLEAEYVPPTFGQFVFSANGRISRSQFWLKWSLPVVVLYIVLYGVVFGVAAAGNLGAVAAMGIVIVIVFVVLLWPNIAIMIKRIHDRNKSGWLALVFYVPWIVLSILARTVPQTGSTNPVIVVLGLLVFAVGVWFFIEFGCMRGTVGENRYGPDPVRKK